MIRGSSCCCCRRWWIVTGEYILTSHFFSPPPPPSEPQMKHGFLPTNHNHPLNRRRSSHQSRSHPPMLSGVTMPFLVAWLWRTQGLYLYFSSSLSSFTIQACPPPPRHRQAYVKFPSLPFPPLSFYFYFDSVLTCG